MILSDEEIKLVKKNESQFVSFKYLDNECNLKEIDTSFQNIVDKKQFLFNSSIDLKTIKGKSFLNPFRSFSTTSFFCENLADRNNQRGKVIELLTTYPKPHFEFLSAEISFWIFKKVNDSDEFTSELVDRYTNLRSDIILSLEKINIPTTIHAHGKTYSESVIGIKGNDIIDLADNFLITKFVIANIADSYGLKAVFSYEQNPNLILSASGKMVQSSETNQPELNSYNKNSILTICAYTLDNGLSNVKIEIITKDLFIPYLAFTEWLLYNIGK